MIRIAKYFFDGLSWFQAVVRAGTLLGIIGQLALIVCMAWACLRPAPGYGEPFQVAAFWPILIASVSVALGTVAFIVFMNLVWWMQARRALKAQGS